MNRKTMAILSYLFYFGIVVAIILVIYFVASAIDKSANKKVSEPDEVIVQPQIEVNRTDVSLKVGDSTRINVKLIDADSSDLIFESSNTSIATVDNNGLIRGVAAGNCVITVSVSESVSVSVNVVVEADNVAATGVFVTENHVKRTVGETYQIVPTVIPKTASDQNVVYKTTNNSIADVSETGLITFKSKGSCEVIVYLKSNPSISATISIESKRSN